MPQPRPRRTLAESQPSSSWLRSCTLDLAAYAQSAGLDAAAHDVEHRSPRRPAPAAASPTGLRPIITAPRRPAPAPDHRRRGARRRRAAPTWSPDGSGRWLVQCPMVAGVPSRLLPPIDWTPRWPKTPGIHSTFRVIDPHDALEYEGRPTAPATRRCPPRWAAACPSTSVGVEERRAGLRGRPIGAASPGGFSVLPIPGTRTDAPGPAVIILIAVR